MTTIAEVSIAADEFALAETLDALPDLELRVENLAADEPGQAMPLVWLSNVDREELESALERDATVAEYRRLLDATDEGEWLYRIEYTEAVKSVCRCLFEHDGSVLNAQVSNGHWTLRLLFPRRDDLSDAMDAVEAQGLVVDIRRMVEADRNADLEATAALTEPQREAIAEAYRQGYYDVPREISLEELANELDISHQALSERLRRANRVLAGEQLDDVATESAPD